MRIAILAYDGCMGAEVLGLSDVLLVANRIQAYRAPDAPAPFDVSIVGTRAGTVRLAGGVGLSVEAVGAYDLLVVPAFDFGADMPPLEDTFGRLRAEQALIADAGRHRTLASVCTGSLLLAEAGVLDGRRATTSWAFAEQMAARYPQVEVVRDALLVRDGGIVTSGAFSAYGDLALQLIRDRAGPSLARAVGRFSLIDGGRDSQAPYLDRRLATRRQESFSRAVAAWFAPRLAERYQLAELARAFHLSSRTLLRRFRAETGRTPLEMLQDLRVEKARTLLEATTLSVAQVAEQVGYLDVATFSRLFARHTQLTPAAFRRKFQPQDAKLF
ncbi:helix-turn-helix domain-containing protein [Stenotrophomonas sp. HITSZ_GD]|uniref:GlxA family transcriptional regulator n=1 Tax=Stenotrophomonas sp. HITSZ_GD TaxID=3037248 RepID=UPI00240DD103|nr:helix-turn-helix domain-containing protein [Stenotrophomonas sp. HITSZ_GD]MDG2526691.1 helix-turn-helix domain-containing protein [Stenotrophomonas sp. HITSZ_GD]